MLGGTVAQLESVLPEPLRSILFPVAVVVVAVVLAALIARGVRGVLERAGVPNAVEGTPFDRSAQRFGISTVGLVSLIVGLFVFAAIVGLTFETSNILEIQQFVEQVRGPLRDLFVAVLILILGLVAGDKAKLATSERLEGVRLSEVSVVPEIVRYTIVFVAVLLALSELGVATGALLILLGIYGLAVVVLGGLAFKDFLAAGAAGMYLLLSQPYAIGDKVEVDGHRGIVQEVDVFVTRIENESEEFIVPNHRVMERGIVRIRD